MDWKRGKPSFFLAGDRGRSHLNCALLVNNKTINPVPTLSDDNCILHDIYWKC
jgi:hypothetical protein